MHDQRIRYPSYSFLLDALSFYVNFLLSIPKLVKTSFHYALHSQQNHEFTHVYPSLQTESFPSPCIFEFDHDISFKPHELKGHPCEPQETIANNTSLPHSSISSNIPNRYRPLHLPLSLHDFPTKHYKYLPKFDGESITLQLKNIYKPLSISVTSLK